MSIQSYAEAEDFLRGGRKKIARPISKTVRVERVTDDSIAIVYNGTDVVTFHSNGNVTLKSSGLMTGAVATQIEGHLPRTLRVLEGDGRWYLYQHTDAWRKISEFADGITIRDGEILNPVPAEVTAQAIAQDAITDAKINDYIERWIAASRREEIPSNSMYADSDEAIDFAELGRLGETYPVWVVREAVENGGRRYFSWDTIFDWSVWNRRYLAIVRVNDESERIVRECLRTYLRRRFLPHLRTPAPRIAAIGRF